jgi:hypothetical protein
MPSRRAIAGETGLAERNASAVQPPCSHHFPGIQPPGTLVDLLYENAGQRWDQACSRLRPEGISDPTHSTTFQFL